MYLLYAVVMYSCVLSIYNALYDRQYTRRIIVFWLCSMHPQNQSQSCNDKSDKNNLNNVNFLEMLLEKKKRSDGYAFLYFFRNIKSDQIKKNINAAYVHSLNSGYLWSHGSFQLGYLTRMSSVDVANISMKKLVKYSLWSIFFMILALIFNLQLVLRPPPFFYFFVIKIPVIQITVTILLILYSYL